MSDLSPKSQQTDESSADLPFQTPLHKGEAGVEPSSLSEQMSAMELAQTRRRLSMMADDTEELDALDGSKHKGFDPANEAAVIRQALEAFEQQQAAKLGNNSDNNTSNSQSGHDHDHYDSNLDSNQSQSIDDDEDKGEQQEQQQHDDSVDANNNPSSEQEPSIPGDNVVADEEQQQVVEDTANPTTTTQPVESNQEQQQQQQQKPQDQDQQLKQQQQNDNTNDNTATAEELARQQRRKKKKEQQQQQQQQQPTPSVNEKQSIIASYYSLSKVGYVPYNNAKVNQDRACNVYPFGSGQYHRAFFGVFDGHGQFGHLVSQFCATHLPKILSRQQPALSQAENETDESRRDRLVAESIHSAFLSCNSSLNSGKIETNFSGSTAISLFIDRDVLYCANAGDSRAVLGQLVTRQPVSSSSSSSSDGKHVQPVQEYIAIDLSIDHKPCREDERNRILASKGRVEACRDANNCPIGPLRVWLRHQEIPGLAMTRSFGDRIAASVGVSHTPEITTHKFVPGVDKFVILASDGIWEFISSTEAVQIVSHFTSPDEAAQALIAEAEHRWRCEEEVIDDITVSIIFLHDKF